MSIHTKFLVFFILLVILPLMTASCIIYFISSEIIGDKSRETEYQSFKQTQFRINQIITNVEYLSFKLLEHEDVQQISNLNEIESSYEFLQYTNGIHYFLRQELRVQPYIHSVFLMKDSGIIYSFGNYLNEIDSNLVREATAKKGVPIWTSANKPETGLDSTHGDYVVSLFRAVNDINKFEVISIEIINIDEKALEQAYSENVTGSGSYVIVDRNGQIVSSKVKSAIGNKIGYQPHIQQVISQEEGFFQTKVDGVKVTVFSTLIDKTGWHVIKIIPDSQINESQKFLGLLIIVTLVVCLTFGIVFSIIQNYKIIKPIKMLKREMDKFKRGNLEIQIHFKQNDEIGQLGFHFKEMCLEFKELIDKAFNSKLKENEARLQMLSMQINPHFLYNTLESIRWVAVKLKAYSAADQLEVLSNMFRYSLKQENNITTVQQEVEHVKNYMTLMNFRFNYIYEIKVHVDEEALQCECLHFVLQPLVENSIEHGFVDISEPGFIQISVIYRDAKLLLSVEDNGMGTDEIRIRQLIDGDGMESSYALKNIHNRIQLKYGSESGIQFYSQVGKGTRVEFTIPASRVSKQIEGVHP